MLEGNRYAKSVEEEAAYVAGAGGALRRLASLLLLSIVSFVLVNFIVLAWSPRPLNGGVLISIILTTVLLVVAGLSIIAWSSRSDNDYRAVHLRGQLRSLESHLEGLQVRFEDLNSRLREQIMELESRSRMERERLERLERETSELRSLTSELRSLESRLEGLQVRFEDLDSRLREQIAGLVRLERGAEPRINTEAST